MKCLRIFSACLLMCLSVHLQAQYRVSEISDELKENANAVVRIDDATFEIQSISKGVFRQRAVITILNAKAKDQAEVVVGYSKLSSVKFIKGYAYDENGKQIYKFKKSDLIDQSSMNGFSVYEDGRIKVLDLKQKAYPYTIEYEYERTTDYLYTIPNWYAVGSQNVSVESSTYRVTGPGYLKPKYKNFNLEDENFKDSSTGGNVNLFWSYKNLQAIDAEPYGPGWTELAPMTYVVPTKFEYAGYKGDMSTWDGMAIWQKQLNEGRDELPASTLAEVRKLVAGLETDREKIKAVYEYLQGKTRYVSIQLGIGGMQPFPAIEVDELGYGDCKALSNYTLSMLKAIGIESYYTLIYGGKRPPQRKLDPDFTMDVFNHIVLCVPNKGDTVWLECTSQTNPFGYMGEFTGDRDVLLITDEGGKIVHTPVYNEDVNIEDRELIVDLSPEGNATASVKTTYKALKYGYRGLNFVVDKGAKDQREWVMENTSFPNFDLNSYTMTKVNDPLPEAIITAEYDVSKYAKVSGKRMFFAVNPLNRVEYLPPKAPDRQTDFIQGEAFTELDSVVFRFPEQFNFEYLPEGVSIESKFGTYTSEIKQEQGRMYYKRKFVLWKGRYSPDEYQEYTDFMKKVITADALKAVINKTT